MKKYILISIALLGLSFASCEKFLKENPKGNFTVDNFYASLTDARAGVNGIYIPMKTDGIYWRGVYFLDELPSDNAMPGEGVNNLNIFNLSDYQWTASNDRVENCWKQHYLVIERANSTIAAIQAMTSVSEEDKAPLIAEAKFLRCLMYYNLVRWFGDVPYVTEPSDPSKDVFPARTPAATVWNNLVQELDYCAANLPKTQPTASTGAPTNGSAIALKAKCYMMMGGFPLKIEGAYENAQTELEKLILNPEGKYTPYALNAAYKDAFEVKNSKESIFAFQFKSGGTGTGMGVNLLLPRKAYLSSLNGNQADTPTPDLFYSFDDNDLRRAKTMYNNDHNPLVWKNKTYYHSKNLPLWNKYINASDLQTPNDQDWNYAIIRYSDILLLYAEVLWRNGEDMDQAREYLNKVRRRGFGKPIDTPDAAVDYPSSLEGDAFLDAVLNERRWEFAFEAHRRPDLLRCEKLKDLLTTKGKQADYTIVDGNLKPGNSGYEDSFEQIVWHDRYYLYPIPQRERTVNKNLTQNPGF